MAEVRTYVPKVLLELIIVQLRTRPYLCSATVVSAL